MFTAFDFGCDNDALLIVPLEFSLSFSLTQSQALKTVQCTHCITYNSIFWATHNQTASQQQHIKDKWLCSYMWEHGTVGRPVCLCMRWILFPNKCDVCKQEKSHKNSNTTQQMKVRSFFQQAQKSQWFVFLFRFFFLLFRYLRFFMFLWPIAIWLLKIWNFWKAKNLKFLWKMNSFFSSLFVDKMSFSIFIQSQFSSKIYTFASLIVNWFRFQTYFSVHLNLMYFCYGKFLWTSLLLSLLADSAILNCKYRIKRILSSKLQFVNKIRKISSLNFKIYHLNWWWNCQN